MRYIFGIAKKTKPMKCQNWFSPFEITQVHLISSTISIFYRNWNVYRGRRNVYRIQYQKFAISKKKKVIRKKIAHYIIVENIQIEPMISLQQRSKYYLPFEYIENADQWELSNICSLRTSGKIRFKFHKKYHVFKSSFRTILILLAFDL